MPIESSGYLIAFLHSNMNLVDDTNKTGFHVSLQTHSLYYNVDSYVRNSYNPSTHISNLIKGTKCELKSFINYHHVPNVD